MGELYIPVLLSSGTAMCFALVNLTQVEALRANLSFIISFFLPLHEKMGNTQTGPASFFLPLHEIDGQHPDRACLLCQDEEDMKQSYDLSVTSMVNGQ